MRKMSCYKIQRGLLDEFKVHLAFKVNFFIKKGGLVSELLIKIIKKGIKLNLKGTFYFLFWQLRSEPSTTDSHKHPKVLGEA